MKAGPIALDGGHFSGSLRLAWTVVGVSTNEIPFVRWVVLVLIHALGAMDAKHTAGKEVVDIFVAVRLLTKAGFLYSKRHAGSMP